MKLLLSTVKLSNAFVHLRGIFDVVVHIKGNSGVIQLYASLESSIFTTVKMGVKTDSLTREININIGYEYLASHYIYI